MIKRKYVLTLLGLWWTGWVTAQPTPEHDSLAAFRPIAAMAQLYQRPAVQLTLHLRREATPITSPSDTLDAEMEVYYSLPNEYVRAEGLEQIVNDSIVLLVNTPARRMLRYHNTPAIRKSLSRGGIPGLPDSSLSALAKRYRALIIPGDTGINMIELTSREAVAGTQKPKEKIRLLYRTATNEPVQCTKTQVLFVPIDSMTYVQLEQQPAYAGRLLSSSGTSGKIYLIRKELSTICSFRKIDFGVTHPPVREGDRLEITATREYKPAKGFEDYWLTQEN